MPYQLYMPNGDYVMIPDNISKDEAMVHLRQAYPDAFPASHPQTTISSIGKGLSEEASNLRTLVGLATGDKNQAALGALERTKEREEKYGVDEGFGKVKELASQGDYSGALSEVGKQIAHTTAEATPFMARVAAGARLGAMAGAPFDLVGAVPGAIIGGLGAAILPHIATNVESQAEQQLAEKKPVNVDVGKAAEYAVPMGAVDVAANYLPYGKAIAGKILGKDIAGLLEKGATDEAEIAARSRLKAATVGGLKTVAEQGILQPAQVMFQRLNTGQDLLSDDALSQYGSALYGATLMAPIGAVGGLSERNAARAKVAEAEKAKAKAAETVQPAQPENVPPAATTETKAVEPTPAATTETKTVEPTPAATTETKTVEPTVQPDLFSQSFKVNQDGEVVPPPSIGEKVNVQDNIGQQPSDGVVERGVAGSPELPIQQQGAEPTGTVEPERGTVGGTEPNPSVSDVGKKTIDTALKPESVSKAFQKIWDDTKATIDQLRKEKTISPAVAGIYQDKINKIKADPDRKVTDLSAIRNALNEKSKKEYDKREAESRELAKISRQDETGSDEEEYGPLEESEEDEDRYETKEGHPKAIDFSTVGETRYSENDVNQGRTGSSTVEDVQNQVRDDFGIHGNRLLDSGKVTVVPDVDSLPPRDDGQAHPEGTRGAVIGDKAYIVAGNIGTGEAKNVMLHEVGAHIGMEQMLPADHYQRLLNDVDTRTKRGEGPFVDARNRAESVVDASDPNRADTVRKETLAYLIENRPDLPLVKRLLSEIKVALNKWSGGRLFNLNADDLRTAAIAALKRVSSAEAAADPNSFYRKNNTPISYSQAAKDTVTRIDDAVRINLPEPTKNIIDKAKQVVFNMGKGTLPDSLVNGLHSFLSVNDFVRFYADKVPALKNLESLMNEIAHGFRSGKDSVNDNIKRWIALTTNDETKDSLFKTSKFDKETWKKFNAIALDSTINQVEVLNTPERKLADGTVIAGRKTDPKNASQQKLIDDFNKLPPELKKIYQELRDEYDAQGERFKEALTRGNNTEAMQKVREAFESGRLKVYLPIFRRGNYWMSFEDAEGHPYRMAFRSSLEREQAMRDAQAQGAKNIEKYRKLDELIQKDRGKPPPGVLGDMMKHLADAGITDQGLYDSIYKTYLDYLPADSLRQRFRGRSQLNYLGMESDIIQAYAHVGTAMANSLNKIKYASTLDGVLNDVKGQVQSSKPEDKERLQQMYMSLSKQVDFFNNPYYNNLVSKMGWFTYIWDLAGNASSAVVAATHMPMMVVPRFGAKYGYENASAALLNAGKDFKLRMGDDGHTSMPEHLKSLTERGIREGALGYHIGQELFDIRQAPIVDYTGLKAKVSNGLNYMMQTADRFNREITLRAAYELELKKMGVEHENATPEQKAMAETNAIDETKSAFGSAYTELGASIAKNPIGRLAFTFKRFALVRMMNLAKTFNEVFSNPTKDMQATLDAMKADRRPAPEIAAYEAQMKNAVDNHAAVRAMATKQLLGYYTLAFAFAGASGMPLVGATKLLAQLISDEFTDTPRDIDAELNNVMGDFAYKGPINHLLNIEMASRTGWNDMFWKDDPNNMAEQTAFGYIGERAFGPVYSMATKSWHGLELFKEGKFERGMEMMAPVAITNGLKALRYAMEGAKTESGKTLKDDVNGYNAFLQAFGFAPADVAQARAESGAMSELQKKLDAQRNSILAKFYGASEAGNDDDMADAYGRMDKFNEAFPDNPITQRQVDRHLRAMREREEAAINGFSPKKQWRSTIESEYGKD